MTSREGDKHIVVFVRGRRRRGSSRKGRWCCSRLRLEKPRVVAHLSADLGDDIEVDGSVRYAMADASGPDSVDYLDRTWVPFEVIEAGRPRLVEAFRDVDLTAGIDVLLDQHGDLASTRLFFSLWALALGRPALRRLLRRFYADFAARVADTLPKGPDQDARAWLIVALLEGSSVLRTIEGVTRNPYDQALKKALLEVASGRVAIGDDA